MSWNTIFAIWVSFYKVGAIDVYVFISTHNSIYVSVNHNINKHWIVEKNTYMSALGSNETYQVYSILYKVIKHT